KAQATAAGGTGFVGAIKAFEDMRQVFGRNALAGVGYRENNRAGLRLGREAHFAAFVVVLDGIGEEVSDHLGDSLRIADTFKRGKIRVNCDVVLLRQWTNQIETFPRGLGEVEA